MLNAFLFKHFEDILVSGVEGMLFDEIIRLMGGIGVDPDISVAVDIDGYCDVGMIENALNCLTLWL